MLGLGVLAIASSQTSRPILLWNASPSVPVGLYRLVVRTPAKGELVAIRLPEPVRSLGAERGYLGAQALIIKPIAAGPGDVVCRRAATVTINGRFVAVAHSSDAAGRPMPRWSGCRVLGLGEVFVLSAVLESFDSRYFGPIDRVHVLGVGQPLWTLGHEGGGM
jgi:conjugative transfer signal peptidase TraF